jgi:PAS domain S-box-containing protein
VKSNNPLTSFYSEPAFLRSTPIVVLIIAVLYFLLGNVNFIIPQYSSFVSPIFLPAGLALASTLILGKRSLLGIWIGAFLLNTSNGMVYENFNGIYLLNQVFTGSIIAFGAVFASIATEFTIAHSCKGRHPFHSVATVLILFVLGSILYSTITSFTGVIGLSFNNTLSTEQAWLTFQTWWLGDLIGIVLITPLILSWFLKDNFYNKKFTPSELLLFGLTTILMCYSIFFFKNGLKYLIFPQLFWSVYRFGARTTTLTILIIALFAILATVNGIGPFLQDSVNNSILFLDFYLYVISICSLFLLTILSERERADNTTKISKKDLKKNETILEAIIESPKDVSIYSIGRNYEYLNFNSLHSSNMKEMNNVDIKLGMTLQQCLVNKTELQQAVMVLDKVFLGESITTIKRFEANNTSWELRTSPIINTEKEIIGATVISTNITEKLKIEEALKESEEKYREIFTNIDDVIFQIDLNNIFMNISPSIKEFAGYTPEELIGQHSRILNAGDNDIDLISYLLNEKKNLINYERMIKIKSGLIKPISLNAKIIYDKNGNPHHIDAVAQDITERKENEQKIALQNQKLQIQNRELEQFVHIASHDLHEPLLTLKYFTDQLKNNSYKDQDEDTQQYLNFIFESADRMQRLVKGLLHYSKIGRQTDISKEDCNEAVNNAISMLTEAVEESKAKIHIAELPTVEGYAAELTELFKHLIANAITYRKKNVPPEINISAKQVNNDWQFAIKDNGIGIEKHNIEKMFIIFKRLNNRDEYSGIGISLSICKKIISLHGGNIWAESSFGHGTTIYFTIPIINSTQI